MRKSWNTKSWKTKKQTTKRIKILTIPTFAIVKNSESTKKYIEESGGYHSFKEGELVRFSLKISDNSWLWKNDSFMQVLEREDFILC